jgi:hypothetical protein
MVKTDPDFWSIGRIGCSASKIGQHALKKVPNKNLLITKQYMCPGEAYDQLV